MKKIVYTLCSALFLFSCSINEDVKPYDCDRATFILQLKPDDPIYNSRSTENGNDLFNENKIGNLHVFFFPKQAADAQVCLRHEALSGLSLQGTGTLNQELVTPKDIFSQGVEYDVYIIANLPSDVVLPATITLGALKALHTVSPITSTSVPTLIPMDGKATVILNPVQTIPVVSIPVSLKRALSKIRVKLVIDPSTDVSAATVAQISLRRYGTIGSLVDNYPYPLASGDYANSVYETGTPSSIFTFYCHESNWGSNSANEAYLMLSIPHGNVTNNYYRVPLNRYTGHVESGRIRRNMIYDISVYIDKDGATNESGSVPITGNYVITDWTSRQITLQTITQHYLGINEYNIVMPNIATYTLKYAADLPISIINLTANCIQYSTTGSTSTVTYTSGQSQYPTISVNSANSTITINSTIPINYVPKNITFTVTNNLGLVQNVTVVQYPARYVTARLSTGNIKPEWNTGGTNLNLFTVNTLVPSSNGSYTLGDPTFGHSKTDSTAIGNKMVSPRFIIASQYGIYLRVSYAEAQKRCYEYGEDIYRSGWRMPTKAEIELINAIQDDSNSAVKALLTGDAYWSAYKYDYYNFSNNAWVVNTDASGTAYIRAVYDLYKNE